MNASMLASDRITHLKIIMTAVLATSLVIMIGIYAKPPGSVNGPPDRVVTASTTIASLSQGMAAGR
jgi:hypothetical protein